MLFVLYLRGSILQSQIGSYPPDVFKLLESQHVDKLVAVQQFEQPQQGGDVSSKIIIKCKIEFDRAATLGKVDLPQKHWTAWIFNQFCNLMWLLS